MNSERSDEFAHSTANVPQQSAESQDTDNATDARRSGQMPRPTGDGSEPATVIVRGETVRDTDTKAAPKDKPKAPRREVSEAKVKIQGRLPALEDDTDAGVQKDLVVVRDGKADLAFNGKLLASAAPDSAPQGQWHEYRVYETDGGKHVFSKVTRSIFVDEQDTHEADVFEPTPSSMPSQLLRSARELTRSRPLEWTDAAVSFFGYDPLAKELYRKLGHQFEEHIT